MRRNANNRIHTNRRPAFRFARVGFFARWIRSQRPFPAAVGDPLRWLKAAPIAYESR
jgi:hypothetical protein